MRLKAIGFIMIVGLVVFGRAQAALDWDIYTDQVIETGEYGTVRVYADAEVDVIGSTVSIAELQAQIGSLINFQDGEIMGTLFASEGSRVNLHGGDVETIVCGINTVHVYGYGYTYPDDPYPHQGLLTGYWADDTPFEIYLRGCSPVSGGIVLHIVPEPACMAFLIIGGVFLRNRH